VQGGAGLRVRGTVAADGEHAVDEVRARGREVERVPAQLVRVGPAERGSGERLRLHGLKTPVRDRRRGPEHVGEEARVTEHGLDVGGEPGRVVEPERRALQYEPVQQRHHHPGTAVGVELRGHAAGPLSVAERLGDALADVLEAGVGLLAQVLVAQQLAQAWTPQRSSSSTGTTLPARSTAAAPLTGSTAAATRSATVNPPAWPASRSTGSKIIRKASPAISRMSSSFPVK
jgi:hypothetical protein